MSGSGVDDFYTQADGSRLWRWMNTHNGSEWACAAQDHGPFCRLCMELDDVAAALIENVIDGNLIAKSDGRGSLSFKMTDKGVQQAKHILETSDDPVVRAVRDKLDAPDTQGGEDG